MFGLFASKEKKIIKKIEKHFKTAKRAADSIVALDVEHNKERIIKLAEIFNEANTTALRIMYENQQEFNFLKKMDDEVEFNNSNYNYIRNLMPQYYMTKKEYTKFEEIMQNAVVGAYGEYKGV